MHTPDLDGSKHRQQMSRAAQRLDLAIMGVVIAIGTLVYLLAPLVAEWMERQ